MNIEITNGLLSVDKDEYKLASILEIEARELSLKNHIVRILSFAFLFSCVGWIFLGMFGLFLFIVGLVYAALSAKKYELRALFRAVDETGNQWSSIKRSQADGDYDVFKAIASEVKREIGQGS